MAAKYISLKDIRKAVKAEVSEEHYPCGGVFKVRSVKKHPKRESVIIKYRCSRCKEEREEHRGWFSTAWPLGTR